MTNSLTKEQKLNALSEFLETRAQARTDGHSAQDGIDCPAHDIAFEWLANELLELVEGNYGYAEAEALDGATEAESAAGEAADQHLWEILVPTVRNDGRPFRLRYHKVWDERVKAVSGGLTIVPPVNGVWVSPEEETFKERMIPVRIMCTRDEIMAIAKMSKEYYEQEAIMVHRVSREVYIVD